MDCNKSIVRSGWHIFLQTLIVAGGWHGSRLSSTELLRPGASAWSTAASLPIGQAYNMRSAHLAGSLYLSGGTQAGHYFQGECKVSKQCSYGVPLQIFSAGTMRQRDGPLRGWWRRPVAAMGWQLSATLKTSALPGETRRNRGTRRKMKQILSSCIRQNTEQLSEGIQLVQGMLLLMFKFIWSQPILTYS